MTLYAFDQETYPIKPGRQAPRVVCLQAALGEAPGELLARDLGARDSLRAALLDPGVTLVGHNTAFDACAAIATWPDLLPLWIKAYREDRVTCTFVREKLLRIAEGSIERFPKNSLLDLVRRYRLDNEYEEGDKDSPDAWRVRYHELDGLPPEQYPAGARRYALADLVVGRVYAAQETAPAPWLADQYRRARGALWLAVTSAWGMRTDPEAVNVFSRKVEREFQQARQLLIEGDPAAMSAFVDAWNRDHKDRKPIQSVAYEGGIVRPIGSKDTKAAAARMREICRAQGIPIPLTKTGKKKVEEDGLDPAAAGEEYTALDADACEITRDPVLIAYARYGSIDTLRGRVERLRLASEHRLPIQPRFDPILKTGRTSSSLGDIRPGVPALAFGDQSQNLPRSPGLRECYRARPGFLILSVDWKAAELHTLAQTCLDLGLDSNMARVLNSGRDIHLWYACQVNGWTYEWALEAQAGKHGPEAKKLVKEARQGAKPCNFGFPGGLGIEKFRLFARKQYGVVFSPDEAQERKGIWLAAFSEMVGYFDHIAALIESGAPLVHFGSGRYRGDLRYTSAANSYFQGRCADMAMDAGWRLLEHTHLHGLPARLWNFAHDEFLMEVPEDCAHEVAEVVVRVMEDAGRDWCPGTPAKAEPALQIYWRKGAEPAYRDGRLIPHEHRDLSPETVRDIQKALASGEDPVQVSWTFGIEPTRAKELAA